MFIDVVEEAHRRGMRVIIDGVFNHCGSFNKWLDRERIYEGKEGYAKGAFCLLYTSISRRAPSSNIKIRLKPLTFFPNFFPPFTAAV